MRKPDRVSSSIAGPTASKVTVSASTQPPSATPPPPPPPLTPASVWTTPAADIGPAAPDLQDQKIRFVCWGRPQQGNNPNNDQIDLDPDHDWNPPPGWIPPLLGPSYETASLTLWQASAATTTRRFWRSATGSTTSAAPWDEPVRWESLGGAVLFIVPWGPGWKGAGGTTDRFILIDEASGSGWEIQGGRPMSWWDRLLINARPDRPLRADGKGKEQANENYDWVCDAAARRTADNAFTYTRRGMGKVPQRVGVTTAAEVAAAVADGHRGVGHMLAVTAAMLETGPLATLLSPATRVEIAHENNGMLSTHPNAPHPRLTKQGLRLASTLTESEIDAILAAIEPDAVFRRTRKAWWMTVSEHGFLVGATTGRGDPTIETTTMASNYPEGSAWAALGHTSASRKQKVFEGYPYNSLYVVAPAP